MYDSDRMTMSYDDGDTKGSSYAEAFVNSAEASCAARLYVSSFVAVPGAWAMTGVMYAITRRTLSHLVILISISYLILECHSYTPLRNE